MSDDKPRPRRAAPGDDDVPREGDDRYDGWFREDDESEDEPTRVHRALIVDPSGESARRGWSDDSVEKPVRRSAPASSPVTSPQQIGATPRPAGGATSSGATLKGRTPDSRKMRKSILLTFASALLPGSGLLGAKSRASRLLGGITALGSVAALFVLGLAAAGGVTGLVKFADPTTLSRFRAALIVATLLVVALIVLTHLVTRPRRLGTGRKATGAVAVGMASLLVSLPLLVGARYTYDAQKLLNSVAKSGSEVTSNSRPTLNENNPWADHPRLNILIVGADSNAARQAQDPSQYSLENLRTDTMMVASINTQTGNTTLIQIPRNLRFMPFADGSPAAALYPDGFHADGEEADDWMTNLWSKAANPDFPELVAAYQDQTYPGAELLSDAVQGITGIDLDYFALMNTDGLQRLINAMGGVTVNINEWLPKGSHTSCDDKSNCLAPGPNQHLMGYDAMWYARSRKMSTDYSRMARQSCLINAIVDQADPMTILTSFEGIADAAGDMLVTNYPSEFLPDLLSLAPMVKDGRINRVVYTNGTNGYSYTEPDFEAMRAAATNGIESVDATRSASPSATASSPLATASASAKPSGSAIPKPTATASHSAAEGDEDVADACAYKPVEG